MAMQQPGVVYASPPGGDNIAMLAQQKLAAQRLAGIQKSFNKKVPPMDRLFKKMGLDVSLKGMLKQSQIFTGTLGAIFQLIGAGIDMFLAPMLPLVIPFIRKMVKALPKFAKAGQMVVDGILWLNKKLKDWLPGFMKNMSHWATAAILLLSVIAFKSGIGMIGRGAKGGAGAVGRGVMNKIRTGKFRSSAASTAEAGAKSNIERAGLVTAQGRKYTDAMVQSATNTGKISRFSFWKKVFGMTGLLAMGGSTMAFGGNGKTKLGKPPPPLEGPDGSKWKWPDMLKPKWLTTFMAMDWFTPGKWWTDIFGKTPSPEKLPKPDKFIGIDPVDGKPVAIETDLSSKTTGDSKGGDATKSKRSVFDTGKAVSNKYVIPTDLPTIDKYTIPSNRPSAPQRNPFGDVERGGRAVTDKYTIPTASTKGSVSLADAAMDFLEGEEKLKILQTDAQKAQVKLNLKQAATNPLDAKGKTFGGGSPLTQAPDSLKNSVPIVDGKGKIISIVEVPPSDADLGRHIDYEATQARNIAAEKVGTSGIDAASEAGGFKAKGGGGGKLSGVLSGVKTGVKGIGMAANVTDVVFDTYGNIKATQELIKQVEENTEQKVGMLDKVLVYGNDVVQLGKDVAIVAADFGIGAIGAVTAPTGVGPAAAVAAYVGTQVADDVINAAGTQFKENVLTTTTDKGIFRPDVSNATSTWAEVPGAASLVGKGMQATGIPGGGAVQNFGDTYSDRYLASTGGAWTYNTESTDVNTKALDGLQGAIQVLNNNFNEKISQFVAATGGTYQTTTTMTGFDNADTGG